MKKHLQPIILSLGLMPLLVVASGCGTMKVTELKTNMADSYTDHAEKNGVVIGIHPMTEKKEIKETFRVNLLEKGLLPILLVAENRSAASSIILAKDRIFVLSERAGATNTSQSTKVASGSAGTALGITGASMLAATSLAGAPLLIAGLKMASDATVIQHNLADKEFYSRTLGPGQKAQGFVYFQYPKGKPPSGIHHVVIELKDSSTGEPTPFDFKVNF